MKTTGQVVDIEIGVFDLCCLELPKTRAIGAGVCDPLAASRLPAGRYTRS